MDLLVANFGCWESHTQAFHIATYNPIGALTSQIIQSSWITTGTLGVWRPYKGIQSYNRRVQCPS